MNELKFRELVQAYLVPLFSGARLESDAVTSTPRHATVAWENPCSFQIKPTQEANYRLTMTRSQPFAPTTAPGVTEYSVVQAFVDVLAQIAGALDTVYERDVMANFVQRIVAKAISRRTSEEQVILDTISQMLIWSNRLYEGQPIAASVGFITHNVESPVRLADMWDYDFSAVLTNGSDTVCVSNFRGELVEYAALAMPRAPSPFAPYRLTPIAEWTAGDKIAIALNRTGEILVLRGEKLVFAFRGGKWHLLTHEPVITQMGCPQDEDIRRAIYSSCLDASFARTGACVGVMSSGDAWQLSRVAPERNDHIQGKRSTKARAISRMVNGRKFQDLDRRMRQELLAIDGATILDHTGTILTVGAILQIEGGSSGGGRLAASIELSKYGLGVKVSQDGGIKGFRRQERQADAEPCFFVM